MRTVELGSIAVTIRKSRRHSIGLSVSPGGAVELRLPYWVSYKRGELFVQSKAAWIQKKSEELRKKPLPFLERGDREEYLKHKETARALIAERLHFFEGMYGVNVQKIRIGRQKSRWGSCSRAGTLSFSYRIVFLPDDLRDYIIVHELCHLKEFNHSVKFWSLVARTFPDYAHVRRILRNFSL